MNQILSILIVTSCINIGHETIAFIVMYRDLIIMHTRIACTLTLTSLQKASPRFQGKG